MNTCATDAERIKLTHAATEISPMKSRATWPRWVQRMVRRMVELFWLCVVAIIIGLVAFVVVGACAALLPVRWLIDEAARRKAAMCPTCAADDREQFMQLVYHRPVGVHRCSKCKRVYRVERNDEH